MTSSSKHTIQRVTDGLFEEVVADVAKDFPNVEHKVELFDALLAKIILNPSAFEVVLVLNEYGDFLSDMASGLVGSLGTGASGNYSFDAQNNVDIAMFDLLDHVERYDLGHALRLSLLNAIESGQSTRDLGGKLNTDEFTRVVTDGIPRFLES